MRELATLRTALSDTNLLGSSLIGESWLPWRSLLLASRGEPLEPDELALFTQLTGRPIAPTMPADELVAVVGRRGGKSRAISVLAAYLGALCDWSDRLAPGERGVVLIIAPDRRQASILLDYVEGALSTSPLLSREVADRTEDAIELRSGILIQVRSSSFRRIRGVTAVAVIGDESAFWMAETGANPDTEILGAVRPSLATTGGPLILISSPHARRGEVYNLWRRYYRPDADAAVLVAQGASRTFNPTLSADVVARALERDPAAARAEYLGEWRADVESFVPREAIEACVERGVPVRHRVSDLRYAAFVDPSGGSSDSMTLAIAHLEDDVAVLDVVRETRPPFSPEATVEEFAALMRQYGVSRVVGDRYAGEWPREAFRRRGISYDLSSRPKSAIFLEFLPALVSGRVRLLDSDRLVRQLAELERRAGRSGRDTVDHPTGGHDDLANAAAGALLLVAEHAQRGHAFIYRMSCYGGARGGTHAFRPGARERAPNFARTINYVDPATGLPIPSEALRAAPPRVGTRRLAP